MYGDWAMYFYYCCFDFMFYAARKVGNLISKGSSLMHLLYLKISPMKGSGPLWLLEIIGIFLASFCITSLSFGVLIFKVLTLGVVVLILRVVIKPWAVIKGSLSLLVSLTFSNSCLSGIFLDLQRLNDFLFCTLIWWTLDYGINYT